MISDDDDDEDEGKTISPLCNRTILISNPS